MKNLSFLAVAGLMISQIATAVVTTDWERPIKGASLTEIIGTKPVAGRRAIYLSLNQLDGAEDVTTFTLHEDTGIRCITAPCPSTVEVEFKIDDVVANGHGTRYIAYEVLKNIPPNVRIARRKLIVDESSMELVAPGNNGFMQREMWSVQVQSPGRGSLFYYGQPTPVATIAQE